MSMSTPACKASEAASFSSAAIPWGINSPTAHQSEISTPSNCISPRSISRMSRRFAVEGILFKVLKEVMTSAQPASTASL